MTVPRITATPIVGVCVIEPVVRRDDRGFFVRTCDRDTYAEFGIDTTRFVQQNQSRSSADTLRGLHFRAALSEAKLVRCARGTIFEAVVDLRPTSPTYRTTFTLTLDDVDHRQILVPPGCAHGFYALTDVDICYQHDAVYEPSLERAVRFDDPDIAIDWPDGPRLLSDRDRDAPSFATIETELSHWFPATALTI